MIVLGLSAVLMFSVSVAALATPKSLQESFLVNTWSRLSNEQKISVQESLDCCGFNELSQTNNNNKSNEHPSCATEELKKDGVIVPLRERETEREDNDSKTYCSELTNYATPKIDRERQRNVTYILYTLLGF